MLCDRSLILYDRDGAPGAIPTRDLPLRRRTLYATELREHKELRIVNRESWLANRCLKTNLQRPKAKAQRPFYD